MPSSEPILQVKNLSIGIRGDGEEVAITDNVTFDLYPGTIMGLVGESGCGKSVTALALLKLLPVPAGVILDGEILFDGKSVTDMSDSAIQKFRGESVSMIFQEPSAALNPLVRVRKQLLEVFDFHSFDGDPMERIQELFQRVGFSDPKRILNAYPHELSGGMLQRVMIAMALLLRPKMVIADEPTTALDVTVQAQIMELLVELQKENGTTVLLITHNLNLIAQYADSLAVMYAGRIVEEAPVAEFFTNPLHPYSQGLLSALPDLSKGDQPLKPIPGIVPSPKEYPTGCRFQNRCPKAFEQCAQFPPLQGNADHRVSCFLPESRPQ